MGKSSPNEARINAITNKRIKTQRFKDSTQRKKFKFFATACVYIYNTHSDFFVFFSLTTQGQLQHWYIIEGHD